MADGNKQLTAVDFVNLHNHSHYSLLDGLQKVPEMLDRVKDLGMESVALTDHGTLSGAIEFYKESNNRDIKPIIGIETYVARRKHTQKEGKKDSNPYHLILLAMNNQGYQNLMRLSTIANIDGFYYKPRIDHDLIEKYHEGLICLSGCIGGEVGDALRRDQDKQAKEIAQWYKGVFGDRYYFEIQDHGHEWDEQGKVNDKLLALGKELDVPVVVTADSHYSTPEDQDAHEALLCVQTGSLISDTNRMSLKDTHLHIKDPKEVIERWRDNPEVITNTKAIADRCSVDIELGKILIPKFPTPQDKSEKDYLEELTYQGLAWRYLKKDKKESKKMSVEDIAKELDDDVIERTNYELGIINSMGFDGYFLIIWDFVKWGKDQGIVFGPGRGSAAGSIVSFALDITDLDPLEHELLFERFLNPDRISMPDIDIDIQDTRRDEVIEYVAQKYGEDKVAHIVTFGKMAARNAIRDVARVLDVPYANADRLAKMVPPPIQGRHIPLEKSVVDDKDLRQEYETNPESKQVIDLAIRMEGTIRSHGVHAAGVVIAPDDIVKFAPLERSQKGPITTQYSMGPVEELGLLKMDFLGLSNLTTIKNALRIIKKVYKEDIDIGSIPLDDKKTYELLSHGDTTGVFQLESAGMKRYIKQLKPSKLDDIIAMVALYRPGPMQFIDDFIARKHGEKKIEYLHDKTKNALESTYGILVYQEQVMQISKEMCGFTGGQADTLRKAVGKKIAALMAKLKDDFIEGGIKHSGADRELMEDFWTQIEEFAAYCFNKSHAACYALIAYQTAYLKAHYPAAFMAALMTSDYGDTDRIAIEISECRHMGIDVLQPDVNESFVEFAVRPEDEAIRFGMSAIKNVGIGAVETILETRDKDGKFKSIEDFAKRVDSRSANKKVWESLIKSGAFDSFGHKRKDLLFNLDRILSFASRVQKDTANGQTDLFGGSVGGAVEPQLTLDKSPEQLDEREQLNWERELLGVYLSKHPLDEFSDYLKEETHAISKLKPEMDGKKVIVGGMITRNREITTRKGSKMSFAAVEDETGEQEIIVFPKLYEDVSELLITDNVVLIKGKVSAKDREGNMTSEVKIIADQIEKLTPEDAEAHKPTGNEKAMPKANSKASNDKPKSTQKSKKDKFEKTRQLYVSLDRPDDRDILMQLKDIFDSSPGENSVILRLNKGKEQTIKLPFKVEINDDVLDRVRKVTSSSSVTVR